LGLTGAYVAGPGGGTVTWQIANLGSADANGIVLVQHLPLGVIVQSITTSPSSFCSQSLAFANSIRLACGLSTLPHGQTWTINVAVVTNATSAETAARITFTGKDSNPANNYSLITLSNSPAVSNSAVVSKSAVVSNSGAAVVLRLPAAIRMVELADPQPPDDNANQLPENQ
jgi:hypothetical protein